MKSLMRQAVAVVLNLCVVIHPALGDPLRVDQGDSHWRITGDDDHHHPSRPEAVAGGLTRRAGGATGTGRGRRAVPDATRQPQRHARPAARFYAKIVHRRLDPRTDDLAGRR